MKLLIFVINFLLLVWTGSAIEDVYGPMSTEDTIVDKMIESILQEGEGRNASHKFGVEMKMEERNLDEVANGSIDNNVAVVFAEFDQMITDAVAELDRLDTRRKKFEAIAPGLEEFLAETDAKPVDENLVMEVLKYLESILNTLNEFQRSFELLESLTLYAHRHAVVPVREQDVISRLGLFEEKVKIPLVQRLEAFKQWFRPAEKDVAVPPLVQLLEEFKLGNHELTEEKSGLMDLQQRLQHRLKVQDYVQNHVLNTPKVPLTRCTGSGCIRHAEL